MTFSVQRALADLDLEPFVYEDANGEPQTLPHAKMMSPEQGARAFFDGQFAQVIDELSPGQGVPLAKLPSAVIEELLVEWGKHSGIDLGSLGKPATPSASTGSRGTPSKRTSRSAASRSRK